MQTERFDIGRAVDPQCGLYVHVPFCQSKCGYCDFFSVAIERRETNPLVERLLAELTARTKASPYAVRTVFLGGGTPTILPAGELDVLLAALAEAVVIDDLVELTVEANPATVDNEKAELLARTGVTRVSLGAQSFSAGELATLERLHSPDDIKPCVETLRRHGIGQVSLDLIFGIPGQTLQTWTQSLRRAIELEVDHIAAYGLTYELGTRLSGQRQRGVITPCDEQLEADMYLATGELLGEAGYEQYEISNYAKPGCRCQHNLIYWRNGPYIGVGPSAAGCIDRRRYKNVSDIGDYVRRMDELGHAETESETLTSAMLATELIMMQLRLVEGLSLESFCTQTGMDPQESFGQVLPRLIERGLITVSDTHIAMTDAGRLLADAVIAELAGVEWADPV